MLIGACRLRASARTGKKPLDNEIVNFTTSIPKFCTVLVHDNVKRANFTTKFAAFVLGYSNAHCLGNAKLRNFTISKGDKVVKFACLT